MHLNTNYASFQLKKMLNAYSTTAQEGSIAVEEIKWQKFLNSCKFIFFFFAIPTKLHFLIPISPVGSSYASFQYFQPSLTLPDNIRAVIDWELNQTSSYKFYWVAQR